MSRRNALLATLFGVLLALTMLLERPWEGDAHARTMAEIRPLLPGLQREVEIGRLRIQPPGGDPPIHIEKVIDRGRPRWVVREAFDHPAAVEKVGRLIASLRALQTRDLESVQAESHGTYKLREGEGLGVQVWADSGEELAHLVIGGLRGQDVTAGQAPVIQFYVRTADDPRVYRSNAVYLPPEKAVRWCDTRFLRTVEESQVRFLARRDHQGGESWRITRDPNAAPVEGEPSEAATEPSGKWQMVLPEAQPVPDYAGDSWLFTMLGLEASAVLGLATDEAGNARFGELTDTVEIGLEEGSFRMDLGALLANNRRAARVHGLPHLYAVEDFDVEQLLQPIAAMLRTD